MKKMFFMTAMLIVTAVGANAQLKKDGTPDMRYKANKEMYGSGYTTPSYSTPSYSTPSYSQPTQSRSYDNGGQIKMQSGYMRSNGTYVAPHLKTAPDNNKWNNLSSW